MAKWYYFDKNGLKKGPYSSESLIKLAGEGIVAPNTIVENESGKTAPASKVKGLPFQAEQTDEFPADELPADVFDSLKEESVPVPTPTPFSQVLAEYDEADPKSEYVMSNRLLVLCICSLIPGLGHFLLGCTPGRCTSLCLWFVVSIYFYLFLWGAVLILLPAFLLMFVGGFANVFGTFIGSLLATIVLPIVGIYLYWSRFAILIADLKKEYRNRYS